MLALAVNLFTDQYIFILISMFLALGASTLLNTTINILTPMVCAGYAGLMVNVFFFIQGIGTSGSQLLLGRYAFSYSGWKMIRDRYHRRSAVFKCKASRMERNRRSP